MTITRFFELSGGQKGRLQFFRGIEKELIKKTGLQKKSYVLQQHLEDIVTPFSKWPHMAAHRLRAMAARRVRVKGVPVLDEYRG